MITTLRLKIKLKICKSNYRYIKYISTKIMINVYTNYHKKNMNDNRFKESVLAFFLNIDCEFSFLQYTVH